MLEQPLVACEVDGIEVDVEVDVLFRPLALKGQNALPYLLVEAEARALGVDGLAVELREQQNVAREGGKPARIEENLVDVLRLLLGGLLVLLQK